VIHCAEHARVLIVDGHPVMRQGLRLVVEHDAHMMVVADASSGRSALQAFSTMRPNVVLIDIEIKDDGIIKTVTEMRALDTTVAIILMVTFPRDIRVKQGLRCGANACFLKTARDDEIRADIWKALDEAS
jgi:DNA-binding NarL/FixJ family response regulator